MNPTVSPEALVELVAQGPVGVFITDPNGRPLYVNARVATDFGLDSGDSAPLPEGSVASYFDAPFDVQVAQLVTRPGGDRVMAHRTLNGRSRIYAVDSLSVADRNEPRVAVLVQDITDYLKVRQRAEALALVASAAAVAGTIEKTMDVLAEAVVTAAGSDACGVIFIDDDVDPPTIRFLGSSGLPDGYTEESERHWRQIGDTPGIVAWLREYRQGTYVVNVGVRERYMEDPDWAAIRPLLERATWDKVVSIPLRYGNRLLGALNVYYSREREVLEEEIDFLCAVAHQAAVAMENGRLLRETQDRAVLIERQRMARELHDSVSQALYAIGLGARTALVQLDRNPQAVIDPLRYVLSLAEGALAEMRALIFELRPDDLDRDGLVAALKRHTSALRSRHAIQVDEQFCSEPRLTPASRLALYRVGQEALHNVTRHAQAKRVRVHLCDHDGKVILEIQDNGTGFDVNGHFPGHLGLKSMRERIENQGGVFGIESRRGGGTHLRAAVPRAMDDSVEPSPDKTRE